MTTHMKSSTNILHHVLPQVFKRSGEVRRFEGGPRFSKKLSIKASTVARSLSNVDSITIETAIGFIVLNSAITDLIKEEDGAIEAIVLNGWNVYASTPENSALLPATVQLSLIKDAE